VAGLAAIPQLSGGTLIRTAAVLGGHEPVQIIRVAYLHTWPFCRSCREAMTGSAHQVKGHDRRVPRHQEITMPKYLLLKHYRGGPEPHRAVPPMDRWAPEDVEAHMAFLRHVSELLEENGEYVDAQALTPARTWVRYGGPDAAPVTTNGPLPETSDLVAGWYMIDVESHERAVELAAYVSSEPGPGGEPLYEWIDVREVMSEAPSQD
jgi:hypothetical protein